MRLSLALAALLPLALAQSESAASATSAIASAVESATGSGSAAPADASSAAPSASGSAASSASGSAAPEASASAAPNNTEYAGAVVAALNAANLSSLAGIAERLAGTPEGQQLFTQLQTGNKTVFAPSNEALTTVSEEVSSNNALLTGILGYHILNNTYTPEGIATTPNHTIGRTLLQGGNWTLPGNRSQPLVLTKAASNDSNNSTGFLIVNSNDNITVSGNATKAANLEIYVVDRVIPIPPRIEEIAPQLVPQLAGVLNTTNLLNPLREAQGITVFAPNDAALTAAQEQLATLTPENITAIVSNHVVNGSVLYSTNLGGANATSAGGSAFTFATNETGSFVTSGNSTARIVQSDIIIANGVVHVIDGLLVNSEANPDAAAAAASSASEAAATANPDPTGPITDANAAQTSTPAGGEAAPESSSTGLGISAIAIGLTAVGVALGMVVV